jgi:hypothetical protein
MTSNLVQYLSECTNREMYELISEAITEQGIPPEDLRELLKAMAEDREYPGPGSGFNARSGAIFWESIGWMQDAIS